MTVIRRAASLPRLGPGQRRPGSTAGSVSSSPSGAGKSKRSFSPELLSNVPTDGATGLRQSLLEAHDELRQVMLALYDTHATKARDRLDIDRFVKSQVIVARVLGDKMQRDQATASFMEISRHASARDAFCDWQLRILLAKDMNWRQIVKVVTQAIAEILQEQVDDPGTVDMHRRAEQRKAKNLETRQKLAEAAFRQAKYDTIRDAMDNHEAVARQRREIVLKEIENDGLVHNWMRQNTQNALRKTPLNSSPSKRFSSTF